MLNTFFSRLTVFLSVVLLGTACSTPLVSPNRSLSFDTRIYVGDVPLDVVVFDTPEERELGLMYVEELPEGKGALFVFEEEREVSFWMKNTRFSMTMLFFDQYGRLVRFVDSISPCTLNASCPSISVGKVKYVVEIKHNNSIIISLGESESSVLFIPDS